MCGIVGYVGHKPCVPILLEGLRKLEYRGYDSAGVAVLSAQSGEPPVVLRAAGKLANLSALVEQKKPQGVVGIGHTRWATHGRPSEQNAHPHVAGPIAVVHNGIIENHAELKAGLVAQGVAFQSDTDTEIIAHLIHREVGRGARLEAAVKHTLQQLRGTYAIAVLSALEPDTIVVAKYASPLVLGVSEGEMYCGSDVPALLPFTREMIFLEDGEYATLSPSSVRVFGAGGAPVDRRPTHIDWSPVMAEKSGYKHFMLKEIFEQPRALEDTLRGRIERESLQLNDAEFGLTAEQARSTGRVYLLACGTSHHAALIARYWIESLAGVPATVELASEFRSRDPIVFPTDCVITITQSGETIDTLAAAKEAKAKGAYVVAVTNVIGSAITRVAHSSLYTHAGPEIGVASTKCFTTQLAALFMWSVHLGRLRGTLNAERAGQLMQQLFHLPAAMRDMLTACDEQMAQLARTFGAARDVLFLGRGVSYPVALEGALKLKEVSYVHAEGYAAGEMKHGPIALVDGKVPVLVVVPRDSMYAKSLGNLQEVHAREGRVIAITTTSSQVTGADDELTSVAEAVVRLPAVSEELSPMLTVLPLQLYAYHVADQQGKDVDQPRNLAKTVTVE
jgi:glucosamine--fructose-6-phosphate aminotransferase (isomerizing)